MTSIIETCLHLEIQYSLNTFFPFNILHLHPHNQPNRSTTHLLMTLQTTLPLIHPLVTTSFLQQKLYVHPNLPPSITHTDNTLTPLRLFLILLPHLPLPENHHIYLNHHNICKTSIAILLQILIHPIHIELIYFIHYLITYLMIIYLTHI